MVSGCGAYSLFGQVFMQAPQPAQASVTAKMDLTGVPPRGYHAAGDDLRLGATDHDDGDHVHALGAKRVKVREGDLLGRAVGVPYDADGCIRRTVA